MKRSFDREKWDTWKAQLVSLADAEAVSPEAVRNLLQALNELEGEQSPVEEPKGVFAAFPSERKDATTQLCTVHPINYSHHVLTNVKRGLQVRKLATRVGQLGAALYAVAETLWHVLLYIHHPQKRSSSVREDHKNSFPETADVSPDVPLLTTPRIPSIVSTTLETILVKNPLFHVTLLKSMASVPTLHEPALADDATQTPSVFCTLGDLEEKKQRQPFLCRRCRQDGRAVYEYDQDRQRLVHTRVLASQQVGQQSSSTRIPGDILMSATQGRGGPSEHRRQLDLTRKQMNTLPKLQH